jgi:rod shape-determining protein MreD
VRPSRWLLYALVLGTALLVQVTALDRLPFPGGGRPQLLVVSVVAVALTCGPLRGAVIGFVAGLFADVVPPGDSTLGRIALVLAVTGYLAGLFEEVEERSVLLPLGLVILATVWVGFGYTLIGSMVAGGGGADWHELLRSLPSAVLYDVVLTPFVIPFVATLVRRLEPEPSLR